MTSNSGVNLGEIMQTGESRYYRVCSPQEGPKINFYATATLHNFCMWQQSHNELDDSHPGHHDTAAHHQVT